MLLGESLKVLYVQTNVHVRFILWSRPSRPLGLLFCIDYIVYKWQCLRGILRVVRAWPIWLACAKLAFYCIYYCVDRFTMKMLSRMLCNRVQHLCYWQHLPALIFILALCIAWTFCYSIVCPVKCMFYLVKLHRQSRLLTWVYTVMDMAYVRQVCLLCRIK